MKKYLLAGVLTLGLMSIPALAFAATQNITIESNADDGLVAITEICEGSADTLAVKAANYTIAKAAEAEQANTVSVEEQDIKAAAVGNESSSGGQDGLAGQGSVNASRYIDANGDGICDNYVDGVCGGANCVNTNAYGAHHGYGAGAHNNAGVGNGAGAGNGSAGSNGAGAGNGSGAGNGAGVGSGFVDSNGDGVCDNRPAASGRGGQGHGCRR